MSVLLLFVAGSTSCRYNEMEPDDNTSTSAKPVQKNSKLEFVIGTANTVSTKSGDAMKSEGVRAFLCEEGQDSLFLVSSVSENRDNVFKSSEPATKGAPVTAENLTDFYVSAYIDSELKYFELVHMGQSDKSVVEGKPVYTLDYYWPSDSTKLDFYACNFNPGAGFISYRDWEASYGGATKALNTKSSGVEQYNPVSVAWEQNLLSFGYDATSLDCMGGFHYSLPEPDLSLKCDAMQQPDYVFAITPGQFNTGNPVPLDFAHCFSAISFRIGSAYMNPEGRQVKEVKISGVPSSGVCTFVRDRDNDAMNFSWNTEGADRKTYTQVIPYEETQTNIANNQIINDGQMTFMLIPHEIHDDAKISITIALHNDMDPMHQHEMVIEKPIKELFAAGAPKRWEAGKKYIYTIVSEEKVDIEVTDKFVSSEPMVKGNLEITNRGNAPVYVRAYIVGWWENEDGDIVSPWLSTDGTWGGASWEAGSSKWIIAEDGFFYYTDQLQPGATTEKLFDTYTLNTTMPPVVGAKLVLNIATQAVVHYYVDDENIWPGVIRTERPSTQSE